MYLIDTDVISEARKGEKANAGARNFFADAGRERAVLFISAVTIGELRQGVEKIRLRGDRQQAQSLERWLNRVTTDYANSVLSFDEDVAHIWGRLRARWPENALDKQIAATALLYGFTVVTRNVMHFQSTGVQLLNPFTS